MQGCLTDDDRVWLSQVLEPSRNIWRVPERQVLLPLPIAYGTYNDQTGMDPHAGCQADRVLWLEPLIQYTEGFEHLETGTDRPLSIIFMRLRIAKVHQQPIAQILGDMPVKALDDRGTGGVVGLDNLA
jgi:hypothetical protein